MNKYQAIQDRIIARRRPPEEHSEVIITSQSDWIRNKWCDVISIGHGQWCPDMENDDGTQGGYADLGIDVGDVAFIIQFHGVKMEPDHDQNLISLHTVQTEDGGDTVWAVYKAKRFRRESDRKIFRGVELNQRMDVKVWMGLLETEGDSYKTIAASKGDYLLTDPEGNQIVYTPEALDWQFTEIPDEGRFGVRPA